MFSFIAIASPGGFRTNIYNTLAASAFCLLLYEPYLIMSVGFQLSYVAVIGIVYLQPMLYRLWEPESLLLDKVWQITCVSVAAQVATFSLGLLYFHQFPVYFLFSNLFVIPGAFAVLVLGIAVIFLSFASPLAIAIGFLLEWTIRLLNMGVFFVEGFPYSLINHVYITTFQCWLLIAAILAIFFLIEFRKFGFVVMAVFCLGIFTVLQWVHYYDQVNHQQLIVYKVVGHSAFDIMDNGKSFFFSDSTLIQDHERTRFHIRPNRLQSGIKEIMDEGEQEFVRTFKGCKIIRHKSVSVLHIHDKEFSIPPSLKVDYLIVGGNSVSDINVFSSLKFKRLILDSSNSFYFANKILEKAKELKWDTHSVLHQGAFIAKL
jgi:competence protein ComEC